jgi:UDPglucose 6-dehydrogenase
MRVVVYGLWHLGCVTAACLADAGFDVVGLDHDQPTVDDLRNARPPLEEPHLADLVAGELKTGRLSFTTDATEALRGADVLWVTFDTPVNERDEADVEFVRARLEAIVGAIRPGTLVLISSQVPVGFTRALARDWEARGLHYAYSPENLRLGKAIEVFRKPERVVVGLSHESDKPLVTRLFGPFGPAGADGNAGGPPRIEWMALESAEMTKHALNAFLAVSVTFINELARLCEAVGADAKEVERGLKSEGRIGPKAYLSPGAAFAGGTLARDVQFLVHFGQEHDIATPLFGGILASNDLHKTWMYEKVTHLLGTTPDPTVAVLGLTYKPGTSTLRRSAAVELCQWLRLRSVRVQAHDPAVHELPEELRPVMKLCASPAEALADADVAVIATEWPAFRQLKSEDFVSAMRRPQVVDQNWFLAAALVADHRVGYVATGRSTRG